MFSNFQRRAKAVVPYIGGPVSHRAGQSKRIHGVTQKSARRVLSTLRFLSSTSHLISLYRSPNEGERVAPLSVYLRHLCSCVVNTHSHPQRPAGRGRKLAATRSVTKGEAS